MLYQHADGKSVGRLSISTQVAAADGQETRRELLCLNFIQSSA
jgi:hypothetical protein